MKYDIAIVGTGFASSFFLLKALQRLPKAKILIVERGRHQSHEERLKSRTLPKFEEHTFNTKGLRDKEWLFSLAMGGGSNCWWGQTPRMLPEDFELLSRFGVGYDWPLDYDRLAPFYEEAETLMGVAGPIEAPYPRAMALPQPPHALSDFDKKMMMAFPGQWFPAPTARASRATKQRGRCCASGVCGLCPVDAKFRIMNDLRAIFKHPNVTVKTGCEVTSLDIVNGACRGVIWKSGNTVDRASADLVFLGANALFNPQILKRSGDQSKLTGKRLVEQASKKMTINFANLRSFNGGTHITSIGFPFYSGINRARRASVLIENYNSPPVLRSEPGKWTNRAVIKLVAENIPQDTNEVILGDDKPTAFFADHTDYAKTALREVPEELIEHIDSYAAVDSFHLDEDFGVSEGHICGTTVMSKRPSDGVVNADLKHHQIRDLLVGGSGVFPTAPGANPSLTIAALSLRAAEKI